MALTLDALPPDIIHCIFLHITPAATILSRIAPVSHALHAVATSDGLWQILMAARYRRLLDALFEGGMPTPQPPLSWREHFFDFSETFMQHAKRFGRCVLVIDGVVYDATNYVDQHPGDIEVLIAAAGHDATATYNAIGHSMNARRLLGTLAVGKRAALVPTADTALWRRRRRRRSASTSATQGDAAVDADDDRDAPPSWRRYGTALLASLRSERGRAALKKLARLGLTAIVHDLTEGRPDFRRVTPAVWHLVSSELLLLAHELPER